MFIGLFLLSFFWLKRAWRIGIKKDYSYVALKRGVPPKDPKKYALFYLLLNLIAGAILVADILLVVFIGLNFEIWTAIGGLTLWIKLFTEFIVSRQAHMAVK
jgi:hypothetical protein